MFKAIITAAALATSAIAAHAESISLGAPMQAASLHTGGIDLVVYYLDREDHFEVVATYVATTQQNEPARLRMGLTDGDNVSFALPDHPQVSYGFVRNGDTVEVDAKLVGDAVASATLTKDIAAR